MEEDTKLNCQRLVTTLVAHELEENDTEYIIEAMCQRYKKSKYREGMWRQKERDIGGTQRCKKQREKRR